MKTKTNVVKTGCAIAALALCAAWLAPLARAQGSRKDDIVFGPTGHPIAGANVRVCVTAAMGTPCSPLAAIYTDATLTVPAVNPFQTDGIGNYHFYGAAGRYQLQVSGPGITGTITYLDVILAADLSSSGSGNNISAFGLTLGGNLNVGGDATITGTLASGTLSPRNFAPTSADVRGNESVQWPRPRVDISAYGAKGDGVTDDTAAIQASITAACQTTSAGYGTVYFPPTNNGYLVTQPQMPSSSPVFTICSGLHIQGGNGIHGGSQFINAPSVNINAVNNRGASPNDAPVFSMPFGFNEVTFENISVTAVNQAFSIGPVNNITFKNVTGSILNTGHANNVFYYVNGPLGVWWKDSAANVGPTQYIWGFNDTNGTQPTGLIFIDGGTFVGCPIKYTNNTVQTQSGPGSWFIRNLWGEVCNSDLISITNPGGGSFPRIANITVDNLLISDSSCPGCAVINMNSAGTELSGVVVRNSYSGNAGQQAAIRVVAGTIRDWHVDVSGGGAVVDNNGNPIASGTGTNSNGGRDLVANTSDPTRMNSFYAPLQANGPITRLFAGGNAFSGMALDPTGAYFNDAANRGYNAAIQQNRRETLDIAFAQNLAPTGVTGTPTTGGSLAAGTYYAWVTTTPNNCSTLSAISNPSAPIVVGGANNAVSVSWVLPPTTVAAAAGYCITLSTSVSTLPAGSVFVSGGSTTSTTLNTIPGSNGQTIGYNVFSPVHRFTYKSLGVNTTSPQFNLDVNGTAAVSESLTISKHLNQGTNGQFAGTVALVGGSATVTFPTPFSSTPVCVANDQSAIATVRVQPSVTSVTLSQLGGTDIVAWMCVGNPN